MELIEAFRERFQAEPTLVRAPGRINIIGEHTDYNDGFVLPAAIDMQIQLAIRARSGSTACRLFARDLGEACEIDLSSIKPRMDPSWANYLLGIAGVMGKQGFSLSGFDCMFEGNIPAGAGLSSSAALECATAVGLNALNGLGLDGERLARIAQAAEHNYAGVLCGIMDQFASMMGRPDTAILLDCRTLDFRFVPLDLNDYSLLLCDSGVKHALASSEYNTRREECEEAVNRLRRAYPEINALRDVSLEMLEAESEWLEPEQLQRARHVVTENQRVALAAAALEAGSMEDLGDLLYDSHQSLQYDYEVSCRELDLLIDATRPLDYVAGARMMGGGFGGCSLNLVRTEATEPFKKEIRGAYREAFQRELEIYPVHISAGAWLLHNGES